MKEVASKDFHVPVEDVLEGARHANLKSITVIGQYGNGRLYVASSEGTSKVLRALSAAPDFIASMEVTDGNAG